jgi:hypothetical protein
MIVAKEEIEFIRLLQNQGIHFCPDCHAPTQGTWDIHHFTNRETKNRETKNRETKYIFIVGCTKCKWGMSLETKSISNR